MDLGRYRPDVPLAAKNAEVTVADEEAPNPYCLLRTTDESGTNDYVAGTDIFVVLDEETKIITFK